MQTSFDLFPDLPSVVKRQEGLEVSRQRMQAELDAKAAEFKEKQQQVSISLTFKENVQHIPPNVYMWCRWI